MSNKAIQDSKETAAAPEADLDSASPLPVWRRPVVTRIDVGRSTLNKGSNPC